MMRPFPGPEVLFFLKGQRVSRIFTLRFVGLITCVIVDKTSLIPVEVFIQSRQLGALPFVRDIVSQHSQFRQGIGGVAMPQFPFGALS